MDSREAPNPLAAAMYYGLQTSGNMQFGALVYEENGRPYDGESLWLEWQFSKGQPGEQEIETIKADLLHCKFVTEWQYLKAVEEGAER
jgi:hypothetical protein